MHRFTNSYFYVNKLNTNFHLAFISELFLNIFFKKIKKRSQYPPQYFT